MSEYNEIIIALIGALVSILTSGLSFGLVCIFGTKFVNASRELIRDSIINDYSLYIDKKEIPRIKRESIDRKVEGLRDMKPIRSDHTIDDIYTEIRRWKII